MSGSKRWPGSRWHELLPDAISILDAAGHTEWTFGGGTALALWLDHRISYDIDIFTRGALKSLTRSFCAETRRVLGETGSSQFPGYYLKLELEGGEIDFLTPHNLIDNPTQKVSLATILTHTGPIGSAPNNGGRMIDVEVPCEILTRKIMLRGENFKYRDAFDLAAGFSYDPNVLNAALDIFNGQPDTIDQLIQRLELMKESYVSNAPGIITPTPGFEHLLGNEGIEICLNGVGELRSRMTPPQNNFGSPAL